MLDYGETSLNTSKQVTCPICKIRFTGTNDNYIKGWNELQETYTPEVKVGDIWIDSNTESKYLILDVEYDEDYKEKCNVLYSKGEREYVGEMEYVKQRIVSNDKLHSRNTLPEGLHKIADMMEED